ncbi:acetyl-CoA acetyltransferase [Halolamina pelagica]|uniref:Acetyl-CoA acetyltransferase n=1 Tax=Halolamina pelagica TaxID=699431 RepID=A0A0P7GPW9_9EURY|nr:acetyl-CoA acetyltransferase [Halolamina pelagica]
MFREGKRVSDPRPGPRYGPSRNRRRVDDPLRRPRGEWLRDLLAEAGADCLDDAGVDADAVDHLYVSNMASGELEGQTGAPNMLAHDLAAQPAYTARIDQTSSSGGAGIYAAWQSVASEASEMTLLVGGEKMTHKTTGEATDVIASLTHPVEYKHGVTLPSFAGLTARLYLDEYDAPRESLGKVAVKNHRNGVDNPKAQFRKAVDLETVLDSPIVADPLRLYDFCPITDGSAALLFCPESVARELTDEYVVVSGVAGATDTHVVHERADPTTMRGVVESSDQAYAMADRDPKISTSRSSTTCSRSSSSCSSRTSASPRRARAGRRSRKAVPNATATCRSTLPAA